MSALIWFTTDGVETAEAHGLIFKKWKRVAISCADEEYPEWVATVGGPSCLDLVDSGPLKSDRDAWCQNIADAVQAAIDEAINRDNLYAEEQVQLASKKLMIQQGIASDLYEALKSLRHIDNPITNQMADKALTAYAASTKEQG